MANDLPTIDIGTKVRTLKPDARYRHQWTAEGWAARRWGVVGEIIEHHGAHGIYYDVQHEDGSVAGYGPTEIKEIKKMDPENEDLVAVEEELHTRRELVLVKENEKLRADLEKAKRGQKVPKELAEAKKILRPFYDALKILFEEVAEADSGGSSPAWRPWIEKAGSGVIGRMLAVVIERGALTRSQLSTLAVTSTGSSSFKKGMTWMRSNKLITVEGETVRRAQL